MRFLVARLYKGFAEARYTEFDTLPEAFHAAVGYASMGVVLWVTLNLEREGELIRLHKWGKGDPDPTR